MNKTPEDEAFEAIEKAQGWRKRQIADAIDDDVMCCRNDVLEEVALALEAFHIPFGQDTINSFATFVRDMKHEKTPEQEPQYAGTARELFTNAAIERLDVRPSTKVYLGTPAVCEQPAHQEPVWDASAPMVVHPHPAFQATPPQSEPVIDKSAAVRIATSLGWEPKRTWVGLTDDEFKQIMLDTYNIDLNVPGHSSDDHFLWRAIEAKLKEKNNG